MDIERYIRLIAGTFVLISVGLARWVNPNWLWFTAFVGVNLMQSSITGLCPMEGILLKMGLVKESCCQSSAKSTVSPPSYPCQN
jgi:hypothetical protein